MGIKIEITGDTQAEVDAAMRAFLQVADANTMPIQDLMMITQKRYLEQGFELRVEALEQATPAESIRRQQEIIGEIDPDTGALVGPKAEAKPAKKPAKTKAPPPGGQPLAGPSPMDSVDVPADTDTAGSADDRAYVLEQLSTRFADPKQKFKAKAFIDKVAGRNKGTRLSLLPEELFPAIRAELEVEFGIHGSNGHGA